MKARHFVTVDGHGDIICLTDSSNPVELASNQMAVTEGELALLRACGGSLDYAHYLTESIRGNLATFTQGLGDNEPLPF